MADDSRQYRTMMLWVLVALIATLIAAYFIVNFTIRWFDN
jgi:hypothetical protein